MVTRKLIIITLTLVALGPAAKSPASQQDLKTEDRGQTTAIRPPFSVLGPPSEWP